MPVFITHRFTSREPSLIDSRIDRAAGVIYGVSLITGGITARGHDLEVDETTLNQILACAQSKGQVPVKLNHQSGVENVCGFVTNFRRDGNKIRGDWHLLKSHPEYNPTLEKAERMPSSFGLSAAFIGKSETKAGKKFARCEELLAVDCVAQPAANPDGLFSEPEGKRKANPFLTTAGGIVGGYIGSRLGIRIAQHGRSIIPAAGKMVPGAVVSTPAKDPLDRFLGIRHVGVTTGKNRVSHKSPEGIRSDSLGDFAKGGSLRVHSDTPTPGFQNRRVVIQRRGDRGYCLIGANCEHYAHGVSSGSAKSPQLRGWTAGAVAGGAVGGIGTHHAQKKQKHTTFSVPMRNKPDFSAITEPLMTRSNSRLEGHNIESFARRVLLPLPHARAALANGVISPVEKRGNGTMIFKSADLDWLRNQLVEAISEIIGENAEAEGLPERVTLEALDEALTRQREFAGTEVSEFHVFDDSPSAILFARNMRRSLGSKAACECAKHGNRLGSVPIKFQNGRTIDQVLLEAIT